MYTTFLDIVYRAMKSKEPGIISIWGLRQLGGFGTNYRG